MRSLTYTDADFITWDKTAVDLVWIEGGNVPLYLLSYEITTDTPTYQSAKATLATNNAAPCKLITYNFDNQRGFIQADSEVARRIDSELFLNSTINGVCYDANENIAQFLKSNVASGKPYILSRSSDIERAIEFSRSVSELSFREFIERVADFILNDGELFLFSKTLIRACYFSIGAEEKLNALASSLNILGVDVLKVSQTEFE